MSAPSPLPKWSSSTTITQAASLPSGAAAWGSLVALTVQNCAVVLLMRYTRGLQTGKPLYRASTIVLTTEGTKLLLSLLLVMRTDERGYRALYDEVLNHPGSFAKCAVPAGLYTLGNLLLYAAVTHLEVTTFQVGHQSKIILTAFWSVVILSRHYSWKKWVSLTLLAIGIVLCSYESTSRKQLDAAAREQNAFLGLVSVLGAATCSSLGGVYFEHLLKADTRAADVSLWMRNVHLAIFSALLAALGVLVVDGTNFYFFEGYDVLAWCVVLLQAAGGLIVAMVVKYADSVMKGFSTGFSILLTAAISASFFGFQPSQTFGVGVVLVIASTITYSLKDSPSPAS